MRSLPDWAKKMMYQHKPKCRTFTEVGADCNCKSKPAPAQSDDILDTMMPVPYENPLKQANDQAKQDLKLLLGASKGGVMGDSPVCASCHDAHVRAVNRVRKWAIEEERSRLEEIMRRAFLALTEPGSGKVKHATDILRSELK